jgi:hypothetical protein
MFGGQHILVGEGAPRLLWIDAMEADERYEAAANGRRKREERRKMAQEARQVALKHTHKLPRRLWDDEKEKAHTPGKISIIRKCFHRIKQELKKYFAKH